MKTISISTLNSMKEKGEKFAAITAYDYTFSRLIEQSSIEVSLVGDSLGNVIQGRDSTIPVTVDEMAYHMALHYKCSMAMSLWKATAQIAKAPCAWSVVTL